MQRNSETQILDQRLWREVVFRNRFGWIIHAFLCSAALFVSKDLYLQKPSTLLPYILIFIGCLSRAMVLKSIFKSSLTSQKMALLHHASMIVIGIGWSLVWFAIDQYYGRFSAHGLFALMTISAFVSGSISPHSPKPLGYICFTTSVAAFPILVVFYDMPKDVYPFAFCITLYFCFCLYQLKMAHVTIRNLIKNGLQVSSERNTLQTLVDAVPGYVSIIDDQLNYLMISEQAKKIFKLSDHIGKPISAQNPDSPFVEFVTCFMRESKRSTITEIKLDMNPGQSMMFLSIQKNPDLKGGAVMVAIPMDELIETREKVKLQDIKAFHTAKLVSLGEMAAGIAHEINNPLAIIMGSSELINRAIKKPDPDWEKIVIFNDKIQCTVDRIASIIKSLRILSRNGEREDYRSLTVRTILEHGIHLSRQRFEEDGVQLVLDLPPEEIYCYGQETQLSQVMMNLLSNAFDATTSSPAPHWVKIKVLQLDQVVQILIQDSGTGISPEHRSKIMEPFFTTKPINKGTGLGLSISKSIIEQHEGTLYLDETQAHTTFIVRLKAAP